MNRTHQKICFTKILFVLISALLLLFVSTLSHAVPAVVSPPLGTPLSTATPTFSWDTGGDSTPIAWWLYAGSSPGWRNYIDSGLLSPNVSSLTVPDLPVDGSTIYVRLFYKFDTVTGWQYVDSQYKSASVELPSIALDPAGTIIQSSTQAVRWSTNDWPATRWWLYAGSARGKSDLFNSGLIDSATATTATVTNLPQDGSTVHLKLWFKGLNTSWQSVERSFVTADNSDPPSLTLPTSGSKLSSPTQLRWVDNGTTVTGWWIDAGTSLNAKDILDSRLLPPQTMSFNLTGFVNNGQKIYIKFWYRRANKTWGNVQYVFDAAETQTVPDLSGYDLVFNDDFSGSNLDPSKWDTGLLWGPYLPINSEEQLYVDSLGMHANLSYSPFEMTGSTLKITASAVSSNEPVPPRPPKDSALWKPRSYSEYQYNGTVGSLGDSDYNRGFQEDDVNYLSGIITSYGSFKMTHGYVEARAKLPAGRGLWPAFWMLPSHYVKDVPEIDVMEFLGQDIDRIYHTYHYFDVANNWQKISTPSYTSMVDDWTDQFHTFGMSWSPGQIIWYVDGVETRRIADSDYRIANQAMYLIANVAVGGGWPGAPDASTEFPATFEIDYIRAYKKKLSNSLNLAADYQLRFSDEFAGSTLDATKWKTHFLWGPYLPINNEEQYYVDALGSDAGGASPFSLSNGVLSITARAADDPAGFAIPELLPDINDSIWTQNKTFQRPDDYAPGNYTSGIITSYESFSFTHGYAEIRAKIPKGDGLWPAFWLLNKYYVGRQPEIDIMEALGENPNEIIHSYHRRNDIGVQISDSGRTTSDNSILGYADDFHTYGVRWQYGKIDWYIDQQKVYSYQGDDTSYQVMYVLANLAVGGDFNSKPVDTALFPTSLDIDYIRVYQEKDFE